MICYQTVVTVIASQGVNDVAVGEISDELVLGFDSGPMMVDVALGQQHLICVDEVAEVATEQTEAADLPDRKLLDNVHK